MVSYRKNRTSHIYPQNTPQQIFVPEPAKVYNDAKEECDGCPYPRHGMSCQNKDGTCLRQEMNAIYQRSRRV